jgi:hypothetical protein
MAAHPVWLRDKPVTTNDATGNDPNQVALMPAMHPADPDTIAATHD